MGNRTKLTLMIRSYLIILVCMPRPPTFSDLFELDEAMGNYSLNAHYLGSLTFLVLFPRPEEAPVILANSSSVTPSSSCMILAFSDSQSDRIF